MRYHAHSARSPAVTMGVGLVVAVETIALHLWLVSRHPTTAWVLTALSILTIGWLVSDYVALGTSFVEVLPDEIELRVGRRATARIPRASIVSVMRPGWRDVPDPGGVDGRDFINPMKPAEPNVLLVVSPPASIRLFGRITRQAGRIGLHVDAPDNLIEALRTSATPLESS